MQSDLLPVPAPVLTRAFQELARGVVNVNEVRKISEFLFPFPYAQLISIMLLLHCLVMPFVAGVLLDKWYWAFLSSFISIFAFWGLNYVAAEIELPFGEDDNDLPMRGMQQYMNRTLLLLLEDSAQQVPRGLREEFPPEGGQRRVRRAKSFIGTVPGLGNSRRMYAEDDSHDSPRPVEKRGRRMSTISFRSNNSASELSSCSSQSRPVSVKSNSDGLEGAVCNEDSDGVRAGSKVSNLSQISQHSRQPSATPSAPPDDPVPPQPPSSDEQLQGSDIVAAEDDAAFAETSIYGGAAEGKVLSIEQASGTEDASQIGLSVEALSWNSGSPASPSEGVVEFNSSFGHGLVPWSKPAPAPSVQITSSMEGDATGKSGGLPSASMSGLSLASPAGWGSPVSSPVASQEKELVPCDRAMSPS